MVLNESLNAAYYGISTAAEFTKTMVIVGVNILKGAGVIQSKKSDVILPPDLQNLQVSKLVYAGGPIVRIAGMSGAMAVVLGAYGAHTLPLKEDYKEREEIYNIANRYHLLHTVALLGTTLCGLPRTAAAFMSLGMILFCGTCYYQALTGDKSLGKLTPIGGTCFIIGWLCMMI